MMIATSGTIENKYACKVQELLVVHEHIGFQNSFNVGFQINVTHVLEPIEKEARRNSFKKVFHPQRTHYIMTLTYTIFPLYIHYKMLFSTTNHIAWQFQDFHQLLNHRTFCKFT